MYCLGRIVERVLRCCRFGPLEDYVNFMWMISVMAAVIMEMVCRSWRHSVVIFAIAMS